jgi:hypothetical protein
VWFKGYRFGVIYWENVSWRNEENNQADENQAAG